MSTDFQHILQTPVLAYDEGLRFFMGEGVLNSTLRRVARDLERQQIDYCLIGAVALNFHGYHRFTEDIDLILSEEGLEQFFRKLVGNGYRPAFEGARRQFRTTEGNVRVEVIVAGEFPGDGLAKPVRFPDPKDVDFEIDGVRTLSLDKLVELKLASGISAADRLKDLADVQEIIKLKKLGSDFAIHLDPSVREKFIELHDAVAKARDEEC